MKKRVLFLLLSVVLILSMGLATAQTCSSLSNYETLVCGTTPNSAIGYGAVDICNNCYACGVADGVCPEDFYSTVSGMQGSCRNCPDPDCSATVNGHITTSEGNVVQGAKVYITYGQGQEIIAITDENGFYSTDEAIAGIVKFHVSYADYDTEIITKELIRGTITNDIDIEVTPGACNEDCTDVYGTVCKAKCNGVNGCSFTNATSYNSFYTSLEVSMNCDGYAPGTQLPVYENTTHIVYAVCCDNGVVIEPRPELKAVSEADNEGIENLGTHILKAKYRGQTVRVVVKSWDSTE